MARWWFAATLGALAVVLLVRLAIEWRRYARRGHIISRRQMSLRIASALVLVLLLGMVVLGAVIDFESAKTAFIYWGTCLGLALAAMVMAVVDLALLRRTFGERRAESYRQLSSYLRNLERSRQDRVHPG